MQGDIDRLLSKATSWLKERWIMNKQGRITELTEQLNELQLPNMASSLESICGTGRFDSLDNLSLLEEMVGSEYEAKTSLKFQNRLKRAHLSGESTDDRPL